MCLVPASILAVVLTQSTLGAVWPVAWVRIIARAPTQYLRLVLPFLASGAVWLAAGWAARATLGRLPIAGGIGVATLDALLGFAQAALVGGFLQRNASEFGYG